jgi:hypothetical protein
MLRIHSWRILSMLFPPQNPISPPPYDLLFLLPTLAPPSPQKRDNPLSDAIIRLPSYSVVRCREEWYCLTLTWLLSMHPRLSNLIVVREKNHCKKESSIHEVHKFDGDSRRKSTVLLASNSSTSKSPGFVSLLWFYLHHPKIAHYFQVTYQKNERNILFSKPISPSRFSK